MNLENVGGTLTGGSTVALIAANSGSNAKVSFVTPQHSRAAPRQIDFMVTPTTRDPKSGALLQARSAAKITFGDTAADDACCTGDKFGTVIFDVGARWQMQVGEATVDSAVDYLRAVVNSPAFVSALKRGILPS